jgi:hypothetical protein
MTLAVTLGVTVRLLHSFGGAVATAKFRLGVTLPVVGGAS